MLECVVNISEGRDAGLVERIGAGAGDALLDVHVDQHHHRSVLTIVGEEPVREVASSAVDLLDLTGHDGVHPRIGVVDVVPFVALSGSDPAEAVGARDRFAAWFGAERSVPCFLYGEERTLPEVRRGAFGTLAPDSGPDRPHPRAGACAVGARPLLVAYNVWLADGDLELARTIATALRGPHVRALGLQVGDRPQVSMNLVAPEVVGPAEVYDAVMDLAERAGAGGEPELVGLIPRSVLRRIPSHRWAELHLAEDKTLEARLERASL